MKKIRFNYFSGSFFALISLSVCASLSAQAKDGVSFTEPKNGAVVTSPFKVGFAIEGMTVVPAGTLTPKTGHHHLLINVDSIAEGQPIPMDATHLHFGKGQTETEVTLAPGKYTLTMQFANGAHQSYGATMSKAIKVTVK